MECGFTMLSVASSSFLLEGDETPARNREVSKGRGGQRRVENWEVKGVSEMDTHIPEAQVIALINWASNLNNEKMQVPVVFKKE